MNPGPDWIHTGNRVLSSIEKRVRSARCEHAGLRLSGQTLAWMGSSSHRPARRRARFRLILSRKGRLFSLNRNFC